MHLVYPNYCQITTTYTSDATVICQNVVTIPNEPTISVFIIMKFNTPLQTLTIISAWISEGSIVGFEEFFTQMSLLITSMKFWICLDTDT